MAVAIETVRQWLPYAKDLATILGIAFAGYWYVTRDRLPKLKVDQDVTRVALDERRALVRVNVVFKNVGKERVRINSGLVRIQQILPEIQGFDYTRQDRVIPWPKIDRWPMDEPSSDALTIKMGNPKVEIWPGEKQELPFDFIIDQNAKVIQVYSGFSHKKNRPTRGWTTSRIVHFDQREAEKNENKIIHYPDTSKSGDVLAGAGRGVAAPR